MLESLLQFDYFLFEQINQVWTHTLLDNIMPWITNKKNWIPFYIIMLLFIVYRWRWKGLVLGAVIGVAVGIADPVSSKVVKPSVERLRPCKDYQCDARLLVNCGGGYSFTSSHATNHFAIAMLLCLTVGAFYRWTIPLFLLWAGAIAYSRVYVGVHFPLDILGGSLLGCLIAWLLYWIALPWLPSRRRQPSP